MDFSPQISAVSASHTKLAARADGISRAGMTQKADADLAGNLVGIKLDKNEQSANLAVVRKKDEMMGTIIDLLA